MCYEYNTKSGDITLTAYQNYSGSTSPGATFTNMGEL